MTYEELLNEKLKLKDRIKNFNPEEDHETYEVLLQRLEFIEWLIRTNDLEYISSIGFPYND